jgi:UDP-glucose 4-epimerase
MRKVLLTGATGFVGSVVASHLARAGFSLRHARRGAASFENESVAIGSSIGPETDWREALCGCDAVVHLAAQTPGRGIPESMFRDVNDLGTKALAEQAKEAGIRAFILMSSIFAVAENSSREAVSDTSSTRPKLPYGLSKLAAESHVAAFATDARIGVSLRPPLVYGANASGNWKILQKIAASDLPLPFGSVRNRRTMVSVDNLADAVVSVLRNATPERSGAYAVADSESVSLARIIRSLREGMGKPARLISFPASTLALPLKALGRGQMAASLFGNLEIDSSRFRETFGWRPVETAAEGIRRSGAGFKP